MKHDPPPAAPICESAGDDPLFTASLAEIAEHERPYQRSLRLTESAPGWRDPRAICREALQRALAHRQYLRPSRRRDFFAWAAGARPGLRLLFVAAAMDLLARGDVAAARAYSRRALHLNQDDLYAQELYFASHTEAPARPDLSDRFCHHPFTQLESQSRNRLMFCCEAWLPTPIGTLGEDGPEALWNSPAAQDIRRSVLDGTFRYCSRMHCPHITANMLPRRDDPKVQRRFGDVIRERRTVLARGPERVRLSHDRSCNLSCPSCRTQLIMAKTAEMDALDALSDRVIEPLMRDAERLGVTGSGDPFASRHYRRLLKRLAMGPGRALKLDLMTNGLLLKASWDELSLSGRVLTLAISIDAATPETYAAVRRGGEFGKLLENLDYVAALRRKGLSGTVRLDFVVQQRNFREMPAAVDLMRSFGFDGMKFQLLRSWGTWTPDEFARQDVADADHPDYDTFCEVLRDPRLDAADVEFFGFHSVRLPQRSRRAAA